MRIRSVGLLCVLGILAACEPGEPDLGYGRSSLAEFRLGREIGHDGSVYGLDAVGDLGANTMLRRLGPSGQLDRNWRPRVEGMPNAIVASPGGDVWVVTFTAIPEVHLLVAHVRSSGTVEWDDLHLGAGNLLDGVVVSDRLRLLVRTPSAEANTLQLIDVTPTREVVRTELLDDANDVTGASLAADGSVLVSGIELVSERQSRRWLRRFHPDGSVDSGFGSGAVVKVDAGMVPTCPNGGVADLSEAIPRAGQGPWLWFRCVDGPSAIVRLLSTGEPDRQWGEGALTENELPTERAIGGMFPAPDDSLYVDLACIDPIAQGCAVNSLPLLVRILPNGTLDPDWGTSGVAQPLVDPSKLVVTASGVMVVGEDIDGFERFHRLVGPAEDAGRGQR